MPCLRIKHSRPKPKNKLTQLQRRRKIACKIDGGSNSCRHCLARRLQCSWSTQKGATRFKNPHVSAFPAVGTQLETEDDSSPLLVSQPLAEDIDVLERYLVSSAALKSATTSPYVQLSNTQGDPVVYYSVPRQRKGLVLSTKSPGADQREIIEQILGRYKTEVIDVYFEKIHPCFPILDEVSFWDMWKNKADRLSHTLMCDIYAISIVFWNNTNRSRGRPSFDDSFIWNQAVIALRDDFMMPGMNTIHAALLDLLGRPVGWVAGNILNAGRTVTLAHSLGLHRNSAHWKISELEKNLRTRLWWGVLIHDHWSSLSHGTPPNISRENHDVPLPSLDCLSSSKASKSRRQSLSTFIHLCALTEILSEMLPSIYALKRNTDESNKTLRRLECALDQWEDDLQADMNLSNFQETVDYERANGVSALWFYYLFLKLVLRRLDLKITSGSKAPAQPEAENSRCALLGDAASRVIDYIISLKETDFDSFWLPYTSHLLVIATTMLLRCTVESKTEVEKRAFVSKLVRLIAHLQDARRDFNWDLADFCLERCAKSVERMGAGRISPTEPDSAQRDVETTDSHGVESNGVDESLDLLTLPYNFFDGEDFMDHLWGPFWEDFEFNLEVPSEF